VQSFSGCFPSCGAHDSERRRRDETHRCTDDWRRDDIGRLELLLYPVIYVFWRKRHLGTAAAGRTLLSDAQPVSNPAQNRNHRPSGTRAETRDCFGPTMVRWVMAGRARPWPAVGQSDTCRRRWGPFSLLGAKVLPVLPRRAGHDGSRGLQPRGGAQQPAVAERRLKGFMTLRFRASLRDARLSPHYSAGSAHGYHHRSRSATSQK